MIIPRHKVCDICKQPVGINKRYYKIKSKDWLFGYAGSVSDNRTHHICEDCMHEFKTYLKSKLKSKEEQNEKAIVSINDHIYTLFYSLW